MTPTRPAAALAPFDRDPYLALNAAANHDLRRASWASIQQALMRASVSRRSRCRPQLIGLKAVLFAGVLSHLQDSSSAAVTLLGGLPSIAVGARPHQLHRPGAVPAAGPREPSSAQTSEQRSRAATPRGAEPPLALSGGRARAEGTRPVPGGDLARSPRYRSWSGYPTRKHAASGDCADRRRVASRSAHDTGTRSAELMAQDRSNEEIAAELFIAVSDREDPRQSHPPQAGADHPHRRRPRVSAAGQSPPTRVTENPPWV